MSALPSSHTLLGRLSLFSQCTALLLSMAIFLYTPGMSDAATPCVTLSCFTCRPLPSVELYDPAAPQRGLLALLKHALWQTLWVDNGPPSGPCCVSALANLVGRWSRT